MKTLVMITAISFVLGLILQKAWMAVLAKWRMRQIVRTDGPEAHLKKSGTLTMGGVAFYAAFLLTILISPGSSAPGVKVVIVVSTICFLVGLFDDLMKFYGKKTTGLKARFKLIVEIGVGILLGLYMVHQGHEPGMIWTPKWIGGIDLKWLFVPFVAVVFVGTINAANLTDGLDGLLAGCYLVVSAAFMFLIYKFRIFNQENLALLPVFAATMGAVAAFLWFNSNPAKIFMGDSGSLFLGGVLAAVSVLARIELFLFVAGGVLVAEALSVSIQVISFKLTKKRVFKMAPLHHHFELSGWSETQTVIRFWIATGICAAIGLWMFVR